MSLYKNGTTFSPAATDTADGATCTNSSDTAGKAWSIDIALAASEVPYAITATTTSGAYTSAASSALVITVDDTAPTANIAPVDDGYINSVEDDADVTLTATGSSDVASMVFSATDGTDTL